jgi:chromate reductase
MRILGISGSLRRESYNTALLRAAADLLPAGVELEPWQALKEVPPFDEDDEPTPAPIVVALREAIAGADAVLFATPEYNGSVPGQLKNALDWASRPARTNPLRNKPVAVVGASIGSFAALSAQADLRRILARIGARVLDAGAAVGDAESACDADTLRADHPAHDDLAAVVEALVDAVHAREPVAA